jgi:putative heme iron utilization protein
MCASQMSEVRVVGSMKFSVSRSTRSLGSIFIVVSWLAASGPVQATTLCATAAQGERIRAAFTAENSPVLHQVAARLGMSEAMVLSGLGIERAYGVEGRYFTDVWKKLESWQTAVVVVMKAGHVFETHGPIQPGEPSKRSNFFNLHGHKDGMSGHLRPDLVGAIYVVSLPGNDEILRGVLFYDAAGDIAFGVYVPGEGDTPPPGLIKQFEQTRKEIRTLSALCP